MYFKKRTPYGVALILALAIPLLGACATHERVIVRESVVVRHMPPPIHEERGYAPGEQMHWVPGHWKWVGHDWVWIQGTWVHQQVPPPPPIIVEEITVAPSPNHFWVPGHWVWRFDANGGWFWVHGAWHR